jgi:hypothetical protein
LYYDQFENFTNFEFSKITIKESLFFFNKFLLDKTISTSILTEYYETSKIILDCISCYLSSKILSHTFADLSEVYEPLRISLKNIFGKINAEKRLRNNCSAKAEIKQKISL